MRTMPAYIYFGDKQWHLCSAQSVFYLTATTYNAQDHKDNVHQHENFKCHVKHNLTISIDDIPLCRYNSVIPKKIQLNITTFITKTILFVSVINVVLFDWIVFEITDNLTNLYKTYTLSVLTRSMLTSMGVGEFCSSSSSWIIKESCAILRILIISPSMVSGKATCKEIRSFKWIPLKHEKMYNYENVTVLIREKLVTDTSTMQMEGQ